MVFIFKIILVLAVVCVVAITINGIEDYHKTNSLVKLSFADTMGDLSLPIVKLTNNGQTFNFLIDTGASLSIIDSEVLSKLKYASLSTQGNAYGIDGNIIEVNYVRMNLAHEKAGFIEDFQVMRLNAFDNLKKTNNIDLAGILGSSFLKRYNFIINFGELIIHTTIGNLSKNDISSN